MYCNPLRFLTRPLQRFIINFDLIRCCYLHLFCARNWRYQWRCLLRGGRVQGAERKYRGVDLQECGMPKSWLHWHQTKYLERPPPSSPPPSSSSTIGGTSHSLLLHLPSFISAVSPSALSETGEPHLRFLPLLQRTISPGRTAFLPLCAALLLAGCRIHPPE